MKERVLNIISDLGGYNPDQIKDTDTLSELGFDSLDNVELIVALEDEFAIKISDKDAELLSTLKISEIIDYITNTATVL